MSRYAWIAFLMEAVSLSQPISPHLPEPRHGLLFDTPAMVWDEALPLGNGMTGALVWGDGRPLRISLDRADLWDNRPVPEFRGPEYKFRVMEQWHREGRVADLLRVYEKPYERPAPTKIPAGRIEVTVGEFARTALDIREAVGSVAFRDGTRAEVFVHATEPYGMARFRGASARGAAVRLVAPPFRGAQGRGEKEEIVRGGDLTTLGYPAPEESRGVDWQSFSQTGAEGFRFAVYVAWRDGGDGSRTLAWSVASSEEESGDPRILAEQRVRAALARGYERCLATHRKWWSEFWGKSSVRIPNAVVERQWFLDTYKWGASARRGAPPITQQAVWTADNGRLPPWKGDYHHDLNTQLSYWPAYSGNRLEDGLSYLDWLWKTRDTAYEWTREFFALPGLNVPMTADLRGRQIGGWRQYTHSATTSAWLAHHFYLHWRYSGDRVFLRDRAYPYLRDVAVFLEAFTAKKDTRGMRTHPLSSSPEINDNKPSAWFDVVTNYDLALDHWVFLKAAELADELSLADDAKWWRAVLAEFPDFAVDDATGLLVAPGTPLQRSHRHLSHLMAIHPLGLMDSRSVVAQRSLQELRRIGTSEWTGYSFAWLASFAARAGDGKRAEEALEIFAKAFTVRSSFHVNGDQSGKGYSKFTYRPFTLEGNFAAAAGLQEMLLQSHAGVVELFPAVPDSWADAEFHSLRAEGAFLISARRRGGKVVRVDVLSERGGLLRLRLDGKPLELPLGAGERRTLRF